MNYDQIFLELKEVLDSNFAPEKSYNRSHVFDKILAFSGNEIEHGEYMHMMYAFHLYQRVLQSGVYGKYKLGAEYVKDVEELHLPLTTTKTKAGMRSLEYPAIAYFHYVTKDFDKALEGILRSYIPIQRLYEEGLSASLLMKIEQVTNEFRVHFGAGRDEKAIQVAKDLLGYCIYDQKGEYFMGYLSEVIESEEERLQLIKYVIDCLLFKWVGQTKDVTLSLDYLGNVLNNSEASSIFSVQVENVKNLKSEGVERWLRSNSLDVLFGTEVSSMLQIIALHYIQAEFRKNELHIDVIGIIRSFNNEKLNLPRHIFANLIEQEVPEVV